MVYRNRNHGLMGLAQLPLKMELKTKAALLAFARDLILK
jgi:5-methylthioribose kinase